MPTFIFPTELPLSEAVRNVLTDLESQGSTPQQIAERARLILELAAGGSNPQVAKRLDLHPTCVRTWRNRWVDRQENLAPVEGETRKLKAAVIDILKDEPKSGVPPTFTAEQVAAIIALACEPPEKAGVPITQWSTGALAEEAVRRGIVERISPDSVGRFLKSARTKTSQGQTLATRQTGRPRGLR